MSTPAEYSMRIVSNDSHTVMPKNKIKKSKSRWITQKLSTILIGFFIVVIATLGATGGTQSASAFDINPIDDVVGKAKDAICGNHDAPSPVSANSDKAILGDRAPFDPPYTGKSVTAYEEYGFSGISWSFYSDDDLGDSGCPFIDNYIANQVFDWTKVAGGLTIGTFTWATNGDLLDSFTEPLDCVISGCHGNAGLKTTLFLNYLTPVVMLGALWGAWNGLVKKRTTETAQGGLWMVGATAFALIFLSNPGLIANKSNDFVNTMTTTITNSVTSATSTSINKKDICYASGENAGNRMAACSMYKAMIVTPWAAGQFGTPLSADLEGDKTVKIGNRSYKDLRVAQIESQTISADETASGKSESDIRDADSDLWDSVREKVKDGVGSGQNKASYSQWVGNEGGERVSIAFSSVVASLCVGILVILISFSTVVLAVGMILLIMMAPLFLLIGIHPGFGRGIALKWLELLLGTILKRIVLASVLALLVGMYQIILQTPMAWFNQIGLITALGVGAIIFRKPLLETLNIINLGGSRTGMESGMDQTARKGASVGAGAVAGVVGGAVAGGGVGAMLAGGFKGGVSGSRSGSPIRAGTMGLATGKRAGGKAAAGRAEETQRTEASRKEGQRKLQERLNQDPYDPDVWREVERWNKSNKGNQVNPPTQQPGSTPHPQSYKEAVEQEKQRKEQNRPTPSQNNNGNNGGGPVIPPVGQTPTGSGNNGADPRPQTAQPETPTQQPNPLPNNPTPNTPPPNNQTPNTPPPTGSPRPQNNPPTTPSPSSGLPTNPTTPQPSTNPNGPTSQTPTANPTLPTNPSRPGNTRQSTNVNPPVNNPTQQPNLPNNPPRNNSGGNPPRPRG